MAKDIPILMYHNIVEETTLSAPDWISVELFEKQILYIIKKGFSPISPDMLLTQSLLPKKPILIIFDDGYENTYNFAFPILKKLNLPFTVFLISDYLSDETDRKANLWDTRNCPKAFHLSKKMIQEMLMSNLLSIGSHSKTHRIFNHLSDGEIEQEINLSIQFLEHTFKQKCIFFAYPGGYVGNKKSTYNSLKINNIKLAFGGQTDLIENLNTIDNFNIHRINITYHNNFTNNRAKLRFETFVHPFLNKISRYNKLNSVINLLLPFYR